MSLRNYTEVSTWSPIPVQFHSFPARYRCLQLISRCADPCPFAFRIDLCPRSHFPVLTSKKKSSTYISFYRRLSVSCVPQLWEQASGAFLPQ